MTSEWHIRMRVGFILSAYSQAPETLDVLRHLRVSWTIVESTDVRVEEVALSIFAWGVCTEPVMKIFETSIPHVSADLPRLWESFREAS